MNTSNPKHMLFRKSSSLNQQKPKIDLRENEQTRYFKYLELVKKITSLISKHI